MAPQTRSRAKSSGNTTYRSTAVGPRQQLFPARRKQVKTYGRPRAAGKGLKQETLTQMGWGSLAIPEGEDPFIDDEDEDEDEGEEEEEDDEEDEDGDEEGDEEEEMDDPAPMKVTKPNTSKKRSWESRRKTAGDELVADEKPRDKKRRKTLGDLPASKPSSSFHTQTLTQFLSNKREEAWYINDSEDDSDAGIIQETPTKRSPPKVGEANSEQQLGTKSSVPSLIQSVTPTNQRKRVKVPSPRVPPTPALIRFHDESLESPLKPFSTNLDAPPPVIKEVTKEEVKKTSGVIPNSYSTTHTSPTTAALASSMQVTPRKELRFQVPENKENITPGRTEPKAPKPLRETPARSPLKEIEVPGEIPDSNYDSDEIQEVQGEEATEQNQRVPLELGDDNISSTDDSEEAETCYGAIGEETQAELLSSAEEDGLDLAEVESDSDESSRPRSVTPTPKPKQRQIDHMTLFTNASADIPLFTAEHASLSSPTKKPSEENILKAHTQVYTQGIESQRLPLEDIRALGPQTPHSDIMVSLHPKPLKKILSREKDHEFRGWRIPPSVSRIWVYSTRPYSELRYMCILGPAKVPGEIKDERGIGNEEFNKEKKCARYAYEILQVYELNNPVSLDAMIEKGWLKSAPQKYVWVPPAVVGELTANLKCALFGDEEQDADAALVASSPHITESQELKAQLQSDVDHSTQHHLPDNVDEVIPSSQSTRKSTRETAQAKKNKGFVKPAVPGSQSGSPVQPLLGSSSQRPRGPVRPSQATTVSSPGVSPEKSLAQAITITSETSAHALHSSSPTMFRNARDNSLRSSQLMTRSQMLPDSLMNNEIQAPPSIIWDSTDDQSD
ncbi:hypothetical protein F5Y06DRAFT_264763 [Hypoxylon sp. FL0890]|nr:hypothetical protein F5Y06DRAFT_264763 [Hypoxylon sp. FL0890]